MYEFMLNEVDEHLGELSKIILHLKSDPFFYWSDHAKTIVKIWIDNLTEYVYQECADEMPCNKVVFAGILDLLFFWTIASYPSDDDDSPDIIAVRYHNRLVELLETMSL